MSPSPANSPIRLDTRWVRAGELSGGLSPADFEGLREASAKAHGELSRTERFGFFTLADPAAPAWRESAKLAKTAWKKNFTDFVVLGIGGSALGAKALQQALAPETIPGAAKPGKVRVRILDNVDPDTLLPVLNSLDPRKTLVNVVSKSGTTVETAAQFLLLAKKFRAVLGKKWKDHFVLTTDPEKGELRRLAREENVLTLDVPPNVGGRYSVLSAVGLFPAAVMGIDGKKILAGAASMKERCQAEDLLRNPAYFFAAAHVLLAKRGMNVNILFPYSERLEFLARWFCQLWGESLGKKKGSERVGLTPIVALGTTDQHSQLQLYLDGPRDKVITALSVESHQTDTAITASLPGAKESGTNFLHGKKLGALFDAERDATKAALARNGVPLLDLRIPAISEHALGELFFFFEVATAFAGLLLEIDPLDQPAVEEGKRLAAALLGKKGGEEEARALTPYRLPDPKFVL